MTVAELRAWSPRCWRKTVQSYRGPPSPMLSTRDGTPGGSGRVPTLGLGSSAGEQLHHDVHHLYPKCSISPTFLTQVTNHSRISSTCDFVRKGNHQYFHISQLLQRAQKINSHACFKMKVTRPAVVVATHSGKQTHSDGQCR